MLRKLHSRKFSKKVWMILAIVIIPAFSLWGIGSALRDKKERLFLGKVFGKSISIQEYTRNYKAIRNQYLIQLGQEQLARLEKYLNLEAQVFDRIILLAEAKRNKIKISNKEVVGFIKRQYAFFQTEGRFNPQLYQEMLAYLFGSSPREFEEEVRDNLTIGKLYQKITNGITLGEDEIKATYNKEQEEISIDYIRASAQDFLNDVSLQEQEALEYYNKNAEEFRKPLSYNLEYVRVANEDEAKLAKISDLLNQGSSLQDAAGKTGLEIKQTGFFSIDKPIPQIGWSTEILRILPKLKAKGAAWAEPIQVDTQNAYFIKLKEEKESHIPPFNEVKEEVNKSLREHKANEIARERLAACRGQLEASGFTQAAEKCNLKSGETELFKRRSYVEGLGDSDSFFEAVQDLEQGGVSQIISVPSGLYIVKLKERLIPTEEQFNEEKEEFAKGLLEKKKQDYFAEFLAKLRNRPNTFMLASESLPANP